MPTDYAIKNGRTVMDATLYTGNGSTQTIVNTDLATQGFKPDFVWAKTRSNAYPHALVDSIRGASNQLQSNSTGTQFSGGVASFNSNGFSVNNNYNENNVGMTYVGWQWQAGQGTTSTNTNGTINSTVSVNTAAGFSIVQYVVPSSGSTFTWGHGLPAAPQFIILKGGYTTNTYNWDVYCASLGPTVRLVLNSTSAQQTYSGPWNNTTPTSTVVSQQIGWYASGDTNIAYCWTPIAGFSQFGSYTGNGSADGPFVYLGFRPRWVMWKRSDSASGNGWYLLDSARNTYNVEGERLFPNLSNAGSNDTQVDFLSNGFKLRTTDTDSNASGGTYVYAAFAENPFKYANAR